MLRLIIIAAVAFVILKSTTFGWRLFVKSFPGLTEVEPSMVKRLKDHVYRLSEEIGDRSVFNYGNLEDAADYISEQFRLLGYQVDFQTYAVSGTPVKNIIASRKGRTNPRETVIVGAHYDTCFNPGADDNASAVAGLLELARCLAGETPERTLKFIAFVNEEPPFFQTENMGSFVFAREAKAKGEKIKAAIILESIGYYSDKPNSQRYPLLFGPFYPNKGNFLAVVGTFHWRWLVKKIVSTFRKHSQFPIESVTTFGFIPGVDFSDHWSFWKEGYPAVMITDTAFYRNPHYHASTDTHEKLNYENIAGFIRGLSFAVKELGRIPSAPETVE